MSDRYRGSAGEEENREERERGTEEIKATICFLFPVRHCPALSTLITSVAQPNDWR